MLTNTRRVSNKSRTNQKPWLIPLLSTSKNHHGTNRDFVTWTRFGHLKSGYKAPGPTKCHSALALATWYLALGTWQVARGGTWHLALGTRDLALGTWHLAFGTPSQPGTRHLTTKCIKYHENQKKNMVSCPGDPGAF